MKHTRKLLLLLLSLPAPGAALSPDEVRALLARVAANQHRNDEAMMLYERQERRITRKEEEKGPVEDKLFRVVPTGTGTIKLLLEDQGRRMSDQNFRHQLRYLEQALAWAQDPKEARQNARVQKWNRKSKERTETVDAARDAFTCTWAGNEERHGLSLVKLDCMPNPSFKARTRTEEIFRHARAWLWIDPRVSQIVRLEAGLSSDVSVGGGVLGKVYSGGRFAMEQAEIAAGVWLPTRFEYNVRGRKFVFGFELHEVTTASQYKRIGPPAEALAAVRAELGGAALGSPAKP